MLIDYKLLPKRFLISGFLYFILIILLPLLSSLSNETGTIEAQLIALSAAIQAYKVRFLIAVFIAPIITYILLLIGTGIQTQNQLPVLEKFGMLCMAAYLTLSTVSYSSQFSIFPMLLQAEKLEWATFWYFNLNTSLPFYLNQLGYTFWAVGAIALTIKLWFEPSLLRFVAIFFQLSAVFQLTATLGLFLQNTFLMQFTIVSGILTVPPVILLIVIGIQIAHQNGQQ